MSDEQNQDRANAGSDDGSATGDDASTKAFEAQEGAHAERGSMRYQDPDSTTPREPTVAEKRARRQAEQEWETNARDAADAAERKMKLRKRIMIGGGVTVGVAALVGAYYASQPDNVTATCSTSDSRVTNDQYCDDAYVHSHGGYVSNGIIFMPLIGGGFQQYHYNYGGTVSNGRVSGGSTVKPPNANVNTRSGKTIQRGGLGVGGGSKSGGGKSGGGSSGS